MQYRDFEFFATPKDGEICSPSDTSKDVKKAFFCEIYHATDEGMSNLLDCFTLKEGCDIPVNFEPGLIAALQRYVDTHYGELLAAHTGQEAPKRADYLNEFLHNTDFDLLYKQKQALIDAREHNGKLSTEVLDGLIGFLNFIGDWAEQEHVFTYSAMSDRETSLEAAQQAKTPLDHKISAAASRAPSSGTVTKKENAPEIR